MGIHSFLGPISNFETTILENKFFSFLKHFPTLRQSFCWLQINKIFPVYNFSLRKICATFQGFMIPQCWQKRYFYDAPSYKNSDYFWCFSLLIDPLFTIMNLLQLLTVLYIAFLNNLVTSWCHVLIIQNKAEILEKNSNFEWF